MRRQTLSFLVLLGLGPALALRAEAQPAAPAAAPQDPAQPIAVTGRVLDGASGRPLAKARVAVEGGALTVDTRADGTFQLQAAVGATLIITSADHEPQLVQVTGATLPDVALALLASTDGDGEVIAVTGEAPISAPGATTVTREELRAIPGAGNDVLSSMDALPGVTSSPFGGPTSFNGLVIRGSAPEDSKILIDGFEVPYLYHNVGIRSILPTESIDTLEYLPGGFDVSYGRASSGVVAVTTRPGERQLGAQGELSVIDGGVLGHGAVGRGQVLVALRRSTVDLVLPSVIPDDADLNLATVPRYWDLQLRYDVPLSARWRLALSAIGADDSLELFADDERDPDRRFFSRTRFLRGIADARWYAGPWSARVAVSTLATEVVFEAGRMQNFNLDRVQSGMRSELTRTMSSAAGLRDVVLRVGADGDVSRNRLDLAVGESNDEGQPMAGNGDLDDIRTRFQGTIWIPDAATWVSAAGTLGPARLTTGLRVDGFARNREIAVQPRAELAVTLTEDARLRLAAGAYRRPPENQGETLDASLDPERATQVVLGGELGPWRGLKLQASLYYTDRSRLLTLVGDNKYENIGRGRTVGGELLGIWRRDAFSGFVSYSLSRSTRVDRPGASTRLFDYDQPHDLNIAGTWKLGRWQLGARFRYSSGQPYTPVMSSVYESDADRYVPIFGDVNSRRVDANHQLDVRVERSWKLGRVLVAAFLDVQNVYLNSAVVGYGYSFDYTERFAFESIPILPSLACELSCDPPREQSRERRREEIDDAKERDHDPAVSTSACDAPVPTRSRRRASPWLLLCCLALAGLALGCDDTDPAWELDNDRIIAVRTTPPQLAAGERAVIDVLVTSPQGGPRVMTPLVAVPVPDSLDQPVPPQLAGAVELQGISWTVTAPDAGALGALRAERELTEGEPLLLRVGVRVDPGNGPLDAVKTVRLGQRGANPTLGAVTIGGEPARDDLVLPADSDVALQVDAAEGQEVFWLTSIGELDDADDAQATLRHDRSGEDLLTGHIAVVVRDAEGGVVWGIWRASIAE